MRHEVVVTARVRGVPLGEVSARRGDPVEVGPSGNLRLALAGDRPFLLRAEWTGPDALLVEDLHGDRHRIGPDEHLCLEADDVTVELRLVRRFPLRRLAAFSWYGSLAWFVVVLGLSNFAGQVDVVWRNRCPWFGIDCPVPPSSGGGGFNAEYLARLLREEFDGVEQGVVEQRTPDVPQEMGDGYLPAGDPDGPKTGEMGGARQIAPEPVRGTDDPGLAPAPKPDVPDVAVPENEGTPVAPPPSRTEHEGEADVADGVDPELEDDAARTPSPPPAEEQEGWGLPDWMDAATREEVVYSIRYARERLKIDPNDPAALSLLAYYQYLAEDLDGADRTYDRLIALFPEDAAAYNNKALIYKRRGEYAKEEMLYRVALALDPDDTTAMNNLAVNLAHQGRFEEALAIMERLETLLPDDPYSDLHRSKIRAEMGEDEAALRYLDKALARMRALDTLHHIEFRQDIRVDPSFARLRQDPRFRAILERYYGADSPLAE